MQRFRFCLMFSLLLSGCGYLGWTPAGDYLKANPDTTSEIRGCMWRRQLCIGMNKQELELSFIHLNYVETDEKTGLEIQNCNYMDYSDYHWEKKYLLFKDGVLNEIENEEWYRNFKIEQYFNKHPERQQFKELVIGKKIAIGMTSEEVLLSWGYPTDGGNKSVGQWGTHDQWVYGNNYLYFENGTLTSWQE